VDGDNFVARLQLHAAYARGGAAHGPNLVLADTDRQALAADHEDVVAAGGLDDPHQLVAVTQVEGDEAIAATIVVLVERRLLDDALPGREEQVALAGEVARFDDGCDRLTWLQWQQVDDGHALGRSFPLGNVERPQPIHTTAVAEEQQERMGCGEDDVLDDVVGLQPGSGDTAATTTLCLEAVGGDGLDVLRLGHHDDELFVLDQIEVGHLAVVEADLADTRLGEHFLA